MSTEYNQINNGSVVTSWGSKPTKFKTIDGRWITNVGNWTDEKLATYNIYPSVYAELANGQQHGAKVVQEEEPYVFYPAVDIPAETLKANLYSTLENAIKSHIQAQVDVFNAANGLSISDIYHCHMYGNSEGYTHKQACSDLWAWNVAVWEYARQVQIDVIAETRVAPTVAELIAELPAYTGAI